MEARQSQKRPMDGTVHHTGAVYCWPCDMWVNGQAQFEDHKIGYKHRKNARRSALEEQAGEPDHKDPPASDHEDDSQSDGLLVLYPWRDAVRKKLAQDAAPDDADDEKEDLVQRPAPPPRIWRKPKKKAFEASAEQLETAAGGRCRGEP